MIRRASVAFLGLLGGAFTGLALTDLLAWAVLEHPGPDTAFALGPALGILTPALAVAGTVIAVALDRRWQHGHHPSRANTPIPP